MIDRLSSDPYLGRSIDLIPEAGTAAVTTIEEQQAWEKLYPKSGEIAVRPNVSLEGNPESVAALADDKPAEYTNGAAAIASLYGKEGGPTVNEMALIGYISRHSRLLEQHAGAVTQSEKDRIASELDDLRFTYPEIHAETMSLRRQMFKPN